MAPLLDKKELVVKSVGREKWRLICSDFRHTALEVTEGISMRFFKAFTNIRLKM